MPRLGRLAETPPQAGGSDEAGECLREGMGIRRRNQHAGDVPNHLPDSIDVGSNHRPRLRHGLEQRHRHAFVDALLERLAAAGERLARRRDEADGDRHGPRVPRLVRAALENLREVAAERLKDDAEAEAKVVDVLARAAADLRRT